jgi:hypothetical protein
MALHGSPEVVLAVSLLVRLCLEILPALLRPLTVLNAMMTLWGAGITALFYGLT